MRARAYPLKQYERPPEPHEREERHPVDVVAWLSTSGGGGPAHVIDLSERGFGARSNVPLPIGSEIGVNLPGLGSVRAQVRWALGGVFGAWFLPRLDERQLLDCLARAPVAVTEQPLP
jgi:hypothetical protein